MSPQHFDHSDDAYALSLIQATLNHVRFVFYVKINVKENVVSLERELKKVLRNKLTRAALSGLLISQSNCEIISNCGKIHNGIASIG